MTLSFVLAATLAIASGPPEGLSKETWAQVEAGVAAYEDEDFARARAIFRKAYAETPHPAILYAWAQAERNGGDCKAAIVLYELYLETDPPTEMRDITKVHIESCESNEPGPPVGPEPPPDATTPDPVEPVTEDRPPRDTRTDAIVAGTLAAGGVSFAAGGTLLTIAQARVAEQGRVEDYQRFDDLDRGIRNFRIAGGVLVGAAVPLVVVGIVWAVKRRRARRNGLAVRF